MDGVKKVRSFILLSFLLLLALSDVNGGRTSGSSNRRTSGGNTRRVPSSSNTGHVTKPSYNTGNSASNSHTELTKLSYPSQNAQPNHGLGSNAGQNSPPAIGWNVPKQQGPPPAYSASNPVGGGRTNINEAPPAYRPNNAPPPNYAGASGNNVHSPITATNVQGVQSGYPQQHMPAGASYYPAGHAPAGATYYPAGHAPAGATYYPAGHAPPAANYYPAGHAPPGATYYAPSPAMPHGGTYLPAGSALPAGATYYSSPPQQSSGLGFGSGLAAGAIGGALLGHALTPQTNVVAQAPPNNGGSSDGKVIIINNGPPGSVQTTQADGTTVITTGSQPAAPASNVNPPPAAAVAGVAAVTAGGAAAAVPLAPFGTTSENTTSVGSASTPSPSEQPPPAGGIVCVPVRTNVTDPNDATKMTEVEQIACYPAPQAQPVVDGNTGVPLAAMNPVPGQNTDQNAKVQQSAEQTRNKASISINKSSFVFLSTLLSLIITTRFY